jgi:predicted phage-related endonuclease
MPDRITHPHYDFMAGVPDAVGDKFVLEIKSCGFHSFKKLYETDEAPDFVVCQANWYAMLVEEAEGRDIESIWIAVLGDTHLYREWNITKDGALISIMMEQAIGFWENNILANKPPEPDSSEHCTKALTALYPKHVTESLDAGTGPETQLLLDLKGATEDLKEAKEKVSGLENRIRAAIGSRIGIETDICRVTWKDQEKITLSRKDLLNDPEVKQYITPELKAKYTTVTQMKVLRKKWL